MRRRGKTEDLSPDRRASLTEGRMDGAMSAGKRTGVPPNKPVSDDEVRAFLDRYRCPVPFHVVRTRFLGSIASPVMTW